MPIPFALYPNGLTADPEDHAARVQTYRGVDFDEIATRISKKGTTVSKSDILAVLEEMETVCEEVLLEGNRVLLGGLARLHPRIRGVFASDEDTFDASRHTLDVGAVPGSRVRATVRRLGRVLQVERSTVHPRLRNFTDLASGERNAVATPGDLATLTGRRLSYDEDQPDEGVFFVPTDGSAEVKVLSVSENRPARLSFLVPELASGTYGLVVRTRSRTSGEVRAGRLQANLEVT